MYMYVYVCMPGAYKSQKKAFDSLELELWMFVKKKWGF